MRKDGHGIGRISALSHINSMGINGNHCIGQRAGTSDLVVSSREDKDDVGAVSSMLTANENNWAFHRTVDGHANADIAAHAAVDR